MKYWLAAAAASIALWPSVASAAPAWQQWRTVPGLFDLGGPRADGSLVVAGSGALYTVAPEGEPQPFARGPQGYSDDPNTEAYIAVSPGLHVGQANCDFARDDIFVLRLHAPFGVTRVDKTGAEVGSFLNLNVPGLNGIAFDTSGSFDHRLLVTAPVGGRTAVIAVDCKHASQVFTRAAPPVEGGMAVAPEAFGAFAGSLIAADEHTGLIWAIAPDGTARQVIQSGLPNGGDIGVESVGFVPPGFVRHGGYVYYSDRKTANNPHPGTDSILRLSSGDLAAAGVKDGDLLAATEGGASMIAVRCDASCRVIPVVSTPTTAHGEGHLAFTLSPQASPSPTPRVAPSTTPAAASSGPGAPELLAIVFVALAAAVGVFAAAAATRRRI